MTPETQIAEAIATAKYFTVFIFSGRGNRSRNEHNTLAEARKAAAGNERAMIYAVTPQDFSVHIENGQRQAC